MFSLTKQEKTVLLILALVITAGSIVQFVFKEFPETKNIVNLVDRNHFINKVDINSATKEELVSIPYIGEYTAANIIRYRDERGAFSSLDGIKEVKGIKDKNFKKFIHFIKLVNNE